MNPLLAQKYQKDDPTLKQKPSSAASLSKISTASLSKTPRNGGGGTESNSSLRPASGGPKPNPKYWQFFRVSGKTREAKFLQYPLKPDTYDLYCIARTDNETSNEFTSIIISNSDNPFWNENFTLDSRVIFKVLKFVVWMAYKTPTGEVVNFPIGKVVIPRKFMKAKDEQSYMLVDACLEDKVSGSVQVQIKYRSPTETGAVHEFTIKVLKAKELNFGNINVNPYAYLHLLPDPNAASGKKTPAVSKNPNPNFTEDSYVYTAGYDEDPFKLDLHVSLWDKVENDQHPFLGHVQIPLGPLTELKAIKKWFTLTTLKNDELFATKQSKKNPNHPVIELVKSFSDNFPPTTERDHNFVGKSGVHNVICAFCKEVISGSLCVCSDCRTMVHQRCQDKGAATCGGYGQFRFTVDFTKFIALDLPNYTSILDLFKENDYYILSAMGKVSNYREEVARCLLRVLDNNYLDFLKTVIRKEIMEAESAQTLFRASSIGSKCLDTFMKVEGVAYLRHAIEGPLKILNFATKPFELDPQRMDKDQSGQVIEDADTNTHYLNQYTAMVLDTILKSVDKVPPAFREVFAVMRQAVAEKFPGNETTPYTSISGFLFLRFFTPAIFAPTIFGLKIGVQDDKSKRRFTLVAKTLQNLSNLADFGKKEPFMAPMNEFIRSRKEDLKGFIDKIAQPVESYVHESKNPLPEEAAKDTTDLIRYVALSQEKLLTVPNCSELITTKLPVAIKEIEAKISRYDKDFNGFAA